MSRAARPYYAPHEPTREYHRARLVHLLTFREDLAALTPEALAHMFQALPYAEVEDALVQERARRERMR